MDVRGSDQEKKNKKKNIKPNLKMVAVYGLPAVKNEPAWSKLQRQFHREDREKAQ